MTVLFVMMFSPVARAADVVVVQTGQMFLNQTAEAKAAAIKDDPGLGRDAVVKTIKLKKGDHITFKNLDKVTHNVYGEGFDLHAQTPGSETKQAFDTPGKQTVHCAIHPKMKFDVEVAP